LLASGSDDRTVRIWDPQVPASLLTIPTHYPVGCVGQIVGVLAVGLDAGILAIMPTALPVIRNFPPPSPWSTDRV
jgi:hypothetical protein